MRVFLCAFTYTNIICLKFKCSINIVYTPIIVMFYNSIKNMLHKSEIHGSANRIDKYCFLFKQCRYFNYYAH